MDNATAQKIKDLLGKSATIGVVVGQNPTLDEMAATLSLYLALRNENKNVSVACPTDPIVEISSLVGIDRVQRNLSGGGDAGDLVVSFPYVDGEIEKVSYTLEGGSLNIIVKASEQGLSFNEKDVNYTRGGGGKIDLLFVIGTPRLSDLVDVIDSEKPREANIINIDNKEENQRFGDVILVSSQFSSVSEQVADLALTLDLQIDQDAAQNLLSGITYATKNFQSANTSPLAFEMGSFLLKKGATRARIATERSERKEDRPAQSYDTRPQDTRRIQVQQPQQEELKRPVEEKTQQDIRDQLQQNQNHNQRQSENQRPEDQQTDDKAPVDWLTPKVYKGSSNF